MNKPNILSAGIDTLFRTLRRSIGNPVWIRLEDATIANVRDLIWSNSSFPLWNFLRKTVNDSVP